MLILTNLNLDLFLTINQHHKQVKTPPPPPLKIDCEPSILVVISTSRVSQCNHPRIYTRPKGHWSRSPKHTGPHWGAGDFALRWASLTLSANTIALRPTVERLWLWREILVDESPLHHQCWCSHLVRLMIHWHIDLLRIASHHLCVLKRLPTWKKVLLNDSLKNTTATKK